MAIRNYITNGSYTRITSAEFDKASKRFSIRIDVTDSSGQSILAYSVFVCGVNPCFEITGILDKDEDISSFIETKSRDNRLVNVAVDSIYRPWNGLVISFDENGEMTYKLTGTVYNTTTQSYLERTGESSWSEPRIPNCDRFFNQYFAIDKHSNYTDIYNMGYFLLKFLPEFKGTVNE